MAAKRGPPHKHGFYVGVDIYGAIDNLCSKDGPRYKELKKYIPGCVSLMPMRSYNSRFMCCFDCEGALNQLPRNGLAAHVLNFLRFDLRMDTGGSVFGPAVIVSSDGSGITEQQAQALEEVCAAFKEDPTADIAKKLGADKLSLLFDKTWAQKLVRASEKSGSPSPDSSPLEEEDEFVEYDIPEEYFKPTFEEPASSSSSKSFPAILPPPEAPADKLRAKGTAKTEEEEGEIKTPEIGDFPTRKRAREPEDDDDGKPQHKAPRL